MPVNLIPIALKALRSPWLYLALLGLAVAYYRHDARSAHAAFDKLKAEYVADSQMAALKQIAQNQATEARWKAKAEETDLAYQTSLDRAQRGAAGYIAAHRVQSYGASASGGPDPLPNAIGPQGSDGPDQQTGMVAVRPEDVNICSINTERLIAAQQWAKGL